MAGFCSCHQMIYPEKVIRYNTYNALDPMNYCFKGTCHSFSNFKVHLAKERGTVLFLLLAMLFVLQVDAFSDRFHVFLKEFKTTCKYPFSESVFVHGHCIHFYQSEHHWKVGSSTDPRNSFSARCLKET